MADRQRRGFAMDRVSVDLKNCYGIKALKREFDFSGTRAFAIYAPNGAMKSSLAQTFQDVATGTASSDRLFPARTTVRKIIDESGTEIDRERVFVVLPYNEALGHTEKTSTLLVNAVLQREYTKLHVAIDQAKGALLSAIQAQSKSHKDFEAEISSAFTSSDEEFYTALIRIQKEIAELRDPIFSNVEYDKIFDEGVLAALETADVKTAIEDYVKRYNGLLAASTYFRKGTFDYYNAGQIATTLSRNGFFKAEHSVNLNAAGIKLEITTQKQLEDVITTEKTVILKDKQLRKKFDDVGKLLNRNTGLRDFQSYMMENEALLSRLSNVGKFKEDILKSYLKVNEPLYVDLMTKHAAADKRRKEIEEEAARQRTQWEEVINIFNERFFVPFKLEAKNRTAVILGDEPMIDLGFTYHDGTDNVEVDKTALLTSLSTGEKRALYILNVIFEIETRKKDKQETLVVFDDIADSFDYQNKYAIIQYLKDISEDGIFKQIIMTHNFDFFRTIESRFVDYSHCLMASKNGKGILLEQATGIKNVFVNDWKKHFFTDPKKKIASIPFLRNLVEYSEGDSDPRYKKLTSLLHWKPDSAAITVGDLDAIYNEVCKPGGNSPDPTMPVWKMLDEQARSCSKAGAGINFENKIVLAIAIRVGAERFMVNKINDRAFVAGITAHQTQELAAKFKEVFAANWKAIEILDRVLLMTPENIHLNSFMYEPIVDMSDEHLKKLYTEVTKLA